MTLNPSDRYTAAPVRNGCCGSSPASSLLTRWRSNSIARSPGPSSSMRTRKLSFSPGSTCSASRTCDEHAQPLAVARAAGERVAVDVPRQTHPRGQHDVGVRARGVQPRTPPSGSSERSSVIPAPGSGRAARPRPRTAPARSRGADSRAARRAPTTFSSTSSFGGRYARPMCRGLPCTRRSSSRMLGSNVV